MFVAIWFNTNAFKNVKTEMIKVLKLHFDVGPLYKIR